MEGADTLNEALSKNDYFPKEFIERLGDDGDANAAEFLKYSDELFGKYCSKK